ncbi:5-hydroxytryptamine receptor-like isoform X1 [Tribolium madens]|uniref:5-hydroxytryptamine receptor-like isoform X1 n=2 Tax=Tribolium madens TaxID=41895 RepID=UPI001CF7573F|nr:5-hydroxytryptamine receptor-like isoform X1 [Tribolium madens]XP_044261686.1 5-hydroxytryptamine receptor-like isoform X1 [Tribolium madens]
MDYVRSHHLWRPLAAMSGKEQEPAVIAAPPENFSLKSTIFHNIITIASSTEESNDVWYPLDGNETSNFLVKKIDDSYLYPNYSLLNSNFSSNFSVNRTFNYYQHDETIKIVTMVGIAVLLGFIILATVIGNVFVIAAILLERNLQNVANYLILSLAVADLLVACLVMPLGAVYEVSQEWTLGPELCDMWTSSDVLCCTASILHLVAIALDRYWAVTNIDYIHQRTSKRIGMMIFIIWFVSFLVCIAPLLGWKDPKWDDRIRDKECLISQDLYYQIFATASSFYLPLLVILILYWRIFQTARKRIRRRQVIGSGANTSSQNPAAGGIAGGLAAASGTGGIAAAVVTIIGRPLPTISETTTAFTTVSSNSSPEKTSFANGLEPDMPTTTDCSMSYQPQHYPIKKKSRDSADSKRERKAAKTLAIITGAFVLCWLPFFIMAVLLPINANLFEKYVISIFLWLGYFNSTLNPIIYTIFSPEFRHAFKKILCGRNYARRNKHFGIRHFQ